jgi:hypothetical protein
MFDRMPSIRVITLIWRRRRVLNMDATLEGSILQHKTKLEEVGQVKRVNIRSKSYRFALSRESQLTHTGECLPIKNDTKIIYT